MERTINTEAKALLGADLDINKRGVFDDELENYLQSLGGEQSRQISFTSMIYFQKRTREPTLLRQTEVNGPPLSHFLHK